MTETLRSYLLSIAAAALAVTLAAALLKQGAVRKTVLLVGGVVVILTAIGPIVKLDYDAFGQYLFEAEVARDEAASGITVRNQEVLSRIIQEKTEAYILDKAAELNAEITVEVTVADGSYYPYPHSVVVKGTLTPAQQEALQRALEQELAIPKERQAYRP